MRSSLGRKSRKYREAIHRIDTSNSFTDTYSKFTDVFSTIYEAVIHLPKPVRRVCYVQICAFMGWFPYLFYSTTWVAEVMATEIGRDPNVDDATRAGSLALLIYSSGKLQVPGRCDSLGILLTSPSQSLSLPVSCCLTWPHETTVF